MPRTHSRSMPGALALWAVLAGPTMLAGQAASRDGGHTEADAWTPFVGGAVVVGSVPPPFTTGCSPDKNRGDPEPGVGVQASAGVRSSRGWDFRARYSGVAELGPFMCTTEVRTEPDGTHRRKTYESGMWGEGLRAFDVEAGYAPPAFRILRIAAGAGVEWDRGVPFLRGGADLRLGSRAQFAVGADVLLLYTPYVVLDEEWEGGQRLGIEVVREGNEWQRSFLVRFGLDYAIGRR